MSSEARICPDCGANFEEQEAKEASVQAKPPPETAPQLHELEELAASVRSTHRAEVEERLLEPRVAIEPTPERPSEEPAPVEQPVTESLPAVEAQDPEQKVAEAPEKSAAPKAKKRKLKAKAK